MIFRLLEDGRLEARIGVPATLASQFRAKQAQAIRVEGQTMSAKVRTVLPDLDPATRARTVILDVSAQDRGTLAVGQIARLDVSEERATRGYWVPTSALTRGARGLWSAFVVGESSKARNSVVQKRDVEVLHVQGEQALIRGTLTPGEKIITRGTHRIVPGQVVRP